MDFDILDAPLSSDDDEEPSATTESFETPPPSLTIGSVFDALPKIKSGNSEIFSDSSSNYSIIFSVNTPNINSLLALPYKKRPIVSSTGFKTVWSEQKEYLRKVTGKGGKGSYQENKERRRSENFPWPESPTSAPGRKTNHKGGDLAKN